MTIKLPWRAAYWPKMIEQIRLKNETKKNGDTQWPYFFDYASAVKRVLNKTSGGQYIHVSSGEMMQSIIDVWAELPIVSRRDFIRRIKYYEKTYLLKTIYDSRKEEFDALVAETNS